MIRPVYQVILSPTAERYLDKLRDKALFRRLSAAIDKLRLDPCPPGCKKLQGEPSYRIRVGNYRIVYEINGNRLLVTVLRVGDRKDVYR